MIIALDPDADRCSVAIPMHTGDWRQLTGDEIGAILDPLGNAVHPALSFDREAAWGMHLSIPSGLAVRFEPGDTREVELVDFGGRRVLFGFAGLTEGALDDPAVKAAALENLPVFLASNDALPEELN